MIFTNLTITSVLTGLLGLAAITFFLQWIRIRHKQKKVATLIFWQKVLEQTRATTFWERFRHLWAYLMVMAICSLLWLALSGPESGSLQEESFTVALLDGSAVMTRKGRFEQATDQLEKFVSNIPSQQRQVFWVGAKTVSLLAPGEHRLLLSGRLEGQRPEAAQSAIEKQIRHLISVYGDQPAVNVVVFGDSPIRKEFVDGLPKSFSVTRGTTLPEKGSNRGVTALGVSRAASGDWFAVDVFFQITGSTETSDFAVQYAGKKIGSERINELKSSGSGCFVIRDVPASGEIIEVSLSGEDVLPIDDSAKFRLPKVEPISVSVADSLKSKLLPILEADPAIEVVTSDPQVVISDQAVSDESIPTLRFVAQDRQADAFIFGLPQSSDGVRDGDEEFVRAIGTIGLDQIDADRLADEAGKSIAVSSKESSVASISVWSELLTEKFNFTKSRSFPIFISGSVRWLSDEKGFVPFAAVGRPLLSEGLGKRVQVKGNDGKLLDLLGKTIVPAGKGTLETDSFPVEVGLLDPISTAGNFAEDVISQESVASVGTVIPNWVTFLLIGALAFVSAEWYLFQSGRMP